MSKLNSSAVARLFSAAIVLNIRPDGYYRSKALALRNNAGKTQDFIQHEVNYAIKNLESSVFNRLRQMGAPTGTVITMDWTRFMTEPTYRAKRLQVTGVNATKVAGLLTSIANDVDTRFNQYTAQAVEFDAANRKKGGNARKPGLRK